MAIDFGEKIYILDGGMGTMLQEAGMSPDESSAEFGVRNPHILTEIHNKYVDAGSDIIYASTFSINGRRLDKLNMSLQEAVNIVLDAAAAAKERAMKLYGREVKVALDIGPVGQLLEPMGTLPFEEALEIFAELVRAGRDKADIIAIETMTDLYEVKAAVLAAKENSDLPVMVSMSFEANGRTFTGTSLEAMALTLEGLGVDAMGINCSLGPDEIFPMIMKLKTLTSVPVFAKPNAGLPDPSTGAYAMDAEDFAKKMSGFFREGVGILGGCCGTTPEFIEGISKEAGLYETSPQECDRTLSLCSGSNVVKVDHVTVIGERINPTGKKRLKQALIDEDYDYILSQAMEQIDAGAEILDVNVGVPKLDDVKMLPRVVKKLQSITDLPLQIDSGNPEAIEAALRVYNGKAIVNSVNGEEAVMDRILPSVKKYGAAVVGLTLDEKGIPDTAEERFAIAERILTKCLEYGIPRENVIIDCLTLTVSAQQKEVVETLKALRMVKDRLGLKTCLGVSNISFGLPARAIINRTFLTMAMECGLDLPIINPNNEDMMASIAAFHVLHNIDRNSVDFIEKYGNVDVISSISSKKENNSTDSTKNNGNHDVFYSIEKGMGSETVSLVKALLETEDEMTVVNKYLIPALDRVGQGFEKGTIFLPQMLQAAQAAQAGFDIIKERLANKDQKQVSQGPIIIATVKGDIHDIGKNIVKVIMENYGFEMIDLGKDVSPELIVETVLARDARMVGLSALMTTTLKSMEETIVKVKEAKPDCRIFVGGAVLTADYAEKIGADYYCKDALKSVEAAQEVFNEQI
ncbi:MAG: homocysteine S-methyltransferase family protein [Lentihominibacter sp.]|nr:homocysteine S-methyltransferase family protein [Lentihominibacter sp.]